MARNRKKKLKYKKERAILSDVLPYEVPATFSNRYFYRFLIRHGIELVDNKIVWADGSVALENGIKLLFGIALDRPVTKKTITKFGRSYDQASVEPKGSEFRTVPYSFRIRHNLGQHRELSICHPINQLKLVDFYHSHKELIIYYSSVSTFSIRKPYKVSQYTYHKDKTHFDSLTEEIVSIEEGGREYENLRSFFVYRDYSNVHKFYESYKFHRAEKKYDHLMKLDLSKCFDSIYTHTMTWALLGKECVKVLRQVHSGGEKMSFGGQFDQFMQSANFGETNGIIIGPEFSRIFAELILQSVDVSIETRLRSGFKKFHKHDYEVFRYVDDYFVFYNSEYVKDTFLDELQVCLRDFKLHLNKDKQENFAKPIVTPITIAKTQIARLLDTRICLVVVETEVTSESTPPITTILKTAMINIRAKSLKTEFKSILKQSGVEYLEIMNYALAIVERRSIRIIRDYKSVERSHRSDRALTKSIQNIIDFTFFIYAVGPRVNTTIKLCRILGLFVSFFRSKSINGELRSLIFDEIFENVSLVIKKNQAWKNTQVESLYLLLILSELGREYWLTEDVLCKHLKIQIDEELGTLSVRKPMSHFEITVLLSYMKQKKRFSRLRDFVERQALDSIARNPKLMKSESEKVILLFDLVSCPHVSMDTKREALKKYGISKSLEQDAIVGLEEAWFTNWRDFDLGLELEAKSSREVY